MAWWFAVIEQHHELQNPTSVEKIKLLGRRLGLGPWSRVLDLGSGKAGPAIVLADEFGCHLTCVERAEEFASAAVQRVREQGLTGKIDVIQADAAGHPIEPGAYDAVLCLGASFIWGGLEATVRHLRQAGGAIAIGEPYWQAWPLPAGFEPDEGEDFVTLTETVERFESAGGTVTGMIASDHDDWDRYETLHWQALDGWLRANPDHPEAEEFRARGQRQRERYLRWERDLLGWAIFFGR